MIEIIVDLNSFTVIVTLSFTEATTARAMQLARSAWMLTTGENPFNFTCESGKCTDRYIEGECVFDFTINYYFKLK